MTKCKIFFACILCFALVASSALAIEKYVPGTNGDERLAINLTNMKKSTTPLRDDQDEFMTYRFMVSADGGENWSDIMGVGDHGMWDEDGEANAWGSASYNWGAVVDPDNNLHFIACLTEFSDVNNPEERVNGVYDISTDATAENVTFTLIAAQGEEGSLYWSDAGMDADGNLYAIWMEDFEPEEGDPYSVIYAARTSEGAWGDAVTIVDGLDPGDTYPHMTPNVGEYFYVVYQIPDPEVPERWNHFVAKVPASLLGEVTVTATGAASGAYYSYYTGSVNAIDQDVDGGFIYFCVRNEELSGTAVANSEDGVNWNIETVAGPQRYPSVALDVGNQIPWVFSNFGPPGEGQHFNWYSYDELGYNGGSWIDPDSLSGIDYDGTENLLYCHNGVWTTEGRLVSGVNKWGYFTPDGYIVRYSDDGGENWSDMNELYNIFDDELVGGYLGQNHLLAGPNNHVWVAFSGQYGESDIVGPEFTTTGMSSVMLGEEKIVSVEVTDASPLYVASEDPLMYYIMFNYIKTSDDTAFVWDYFFTESMDVNEDGHGTYYFTMPDEALYAYWENDTLKYRYEPLAAGDMVCFYTDGYDEAETYAAEHNGDWFNVWTVNEGWTKVKDSDATVPVKFEVGQNYPNPFNSSTVIPFSLNRPSNVTVSVYDVNGRLVDTIFQGQVTAGQHSVAWLGEGVTSGVYIYTLEADNVRHVGKMTLLR